MGRRFFQRLQEGVGSGAGDLMGLVDDVELGFKLGRRVLDALAKLAYVVDTAIAGGVDFNHIGCGTVVDRSTVDALVARSFERIGIKAIDCLRQQASSRCLTCAAGPAKEVCVGDAVQQDCVS